MRGRGLRRHFTGRSGDGGEGWGVSRWVPPFSTNVLCHLKPDTVCVCVSVV